MKVSLNWIRDINTRYRSAADPASEGVEKLVEKIGAQLGTVEEVIDVGKKYEDIVIVKVISCEKHPNADKLSICLIDDGDVVKKVKRNKNGLVQVVCGAPNVKTGMLAVWIPPGATVPATLDKDPFVIEAREIRGEQSNGMLASAKELALSDSHEGILVVDEQAKPGTAFAKLYDLDDYIIDIENKMFTHRPDLFGMLGVARELAGIQHHMYKSPEWYRLDAQVPSSNARDDHKLLIKNEIPKLVPRFNALVMKDVLVEPSPLWLQVRLSSVGIRPINNIVDLTNFFMLETAQPIHAYDYDKVRSIDKTAHATLTVRMSKKGEELTLLGGKTIKLDEGAIVIATAKKAIGLGGIMGGADTEVDENTKNITLEAASFDMNTIRRTAMAYGLFTDAATRFTKGQSPLQTRPVIAKMANNVIRLAGGRVAGKLMDDNHLRPEIIKRGSVHPPVSVSSDFINERLGLNLGSSDIKKLLKNVEFEVANQDSKLIIKAPFWRTDIEIAEDVVEEVGRLHGYDNLPQVLPRRDLTPAQPEPLLSFKSRLRDILVSAGGNEVLTYSFVRGDLLDKVGQDKSMAFKLSNALSPDLQYYRLSLIPSLLGKVHPNIKSGFKEFAIFEINKTHNKSQKDKAEPDLPKEIETLALVFASTTKSATQNGAAFYESRKFLDFLAAQLGLTFNYKPTSQESDYPPVKPFDHNRSALVSDLKTGALLGMVGEFKPLITQRLKLPVFSAGFEIAIEELLKVAPSQRKYQPLNRYPGVEQDFCLRHDNKLSYGELTDFMNQQLEKVAKEHGYKYELSALDIFQKANNKKHKQTTWRIKLAHPQRTLTTAETNNLLDSIAKAAKEKLDAQRI